MISKMLGNRYEILEKIGGGGMSLIYRAKDTYLNRFVAVKVLREHLTNDEEFVRRFRREAQAVASLSHPNIVSIYDVGQDNNVYYLIMEYVQGRNLKEIINEQAPLSVGEVVDIGKQICDALEHAHENNIIHRDIKPHNILITRGGKVKVTDFGLARAVSTATVTHTNNIMGSVHYLSPEQAKGEISDEKSDIYSLGVVLYEMITGKLPFEGDSPITIALKQIQANPNPPTKINPKMPSSLENVILKAMAKNPKERYEYARQLRMDLVSALLNNVSSISNLKPEVNKVSEDTIEIPHLGVKKELEKTTNNTNYESQKSKKKLNNWGKLLIALLLIGFIWGFFLSAKGFLTKNEVVVPNLIASTVKEAQDKLVEQKLKLKIIKEVNDPTVEKGRIIKQNPNPEQVVVEGREIEVIVSSGPNLVQVPNVIGQQYLVAEVELSNKGFEVKIVQEFSDKFDKNSVISQKPDAGTEIAEGSIVELVISKGTEPQYVSMPNLIGKSIDDAKETLENGGLVLGVITSDSSQIYFNNYILRQDVFPGTQILQGSTVNLVVSSGPGPSAHVADVEVKLKNDGTVKIVVEDIRGTTMAYEHYHSAGDIVNERVNYYGKANIKVYVNDILTGQKMFN